MTDPFAPAVIEKKELTDKDIYYNEIDEHGNVGKYKIESGVPVKVADLGNIKAFYNRALARAALMTTEDVMELDKGELTHLELAAIALAGNAAAGDLKATQELSDRLVGKAKLISESTNLNVTIDDILNGVEAKGAVIEGEKT